MKKFILAVFLLASGPVVARAAVTPVAGSSFTYVLISTALQPNTTGPAGINVSSGTILNFSASNLKSTGTLTLTGATINGTTTNNSSTTYTGNSVFNNGISVSSGPTVPAEFFVGKTSVTTTTTLFVINGSTDDVEFPIMTQPFQGTTLNTYTATFVASTAKQIGVADSGGLMLVHGSNGTDQFVDLLLCGFNTTPTAVTSKTTAGSPAVRTYSATNALVKVSLASGTYSIHTSCLKISNR